MKTSSATLAALLALMAPLSACADPNRPLGEASRPVESSEIAAVRVYADWCPNCRALDPKLEVVAESEAWEGVTFVRIDYTKKDKEAVFAEADRLGVGPAIRAHFASGIKTGQLLLVDITSQAVIDVVTHKESESAISERIHAAQNGS